MGLTNWKQAPDGKILKSDVAIAKNYLNEAHIRELNRIVSTYLDLAENRAERGVTTTMQDWANFLNQFLELSQYPILQDTGKISANQFQSLFNDSPVKKEKIEQQIYNKPQSEKPSFPSLNLSSITNAASSLFSLFDIKLQGDNYEDIAFAKRLFKFCSPDKSDRFFR